jgi:hypothetical protein
VLWQAKSKQLQKLWATEILISSINFHAPERIQIYKIDWSVVQPSIENNKYIREIGIFGIFLHKVPVVVCTKN